MTKKIILLSYLIMLAAVLAGCHAAQEKAWTETMNITNQKIAEDPKLSANIDRIELERRQFIRIYIKKQKARSNFGKITVEVAKIAGEALFSNVGNKMKELIVFGNLVDGDELIVCRYTKETGVEVQKDRSMLGM